MIPMSYYIYLGAALFCIGLYGVFARRNAIQILMSLELMMNAVVMNFVVFSKYITPELVTGQIFAIFIFVVVAAEVGVGLAIFLAIYRSYLDIDIDKLNTLKG